MRLPDSAGGSEAHISDSKVAFERERFRLSDLQLVEIRLKRKFKIV